MNPIVAGLAAWRATRLWQQDSITSAMRDRTSKWLLDVDETYQPNEPGAARATTWGPWLEELLGCWRCLSVWFAACATLATRRGRPAGELAVDALAAAAVAYVIEERMRP